MTMKEIVKSADDRIAQAKYQQRLKLKQARDAQRRKDQRRNYAVGELVIKHFPELLCIEPGTKAENALRLASLEAFLTELAADQELVEKIKERAHLCPQHVSGRREKKEGQAHG